MPTFGDLDAYYDPGLTLTVRGREYTLPLPSAELGLWARRIAQSAGEVSSASDEQELTHATERAASRIAALPTLPGDITFEERILGPAYHQMVKDQVPDPYVQFAAQTGYVWIIGGEEAAQRYWEAGGRSEARGPSNRASRRAAAQMTSTAVGSATKPQASTSGTSSRRKSKRNGRGGRARGANS